MARLAIDKDFLDDYSKLPKPVQASVKMAIDKFAEHVHAGLHLEKLTRCKDDRIRTIRVDQSWRGVVLAPDAGDTYSLIRVMPHDKAIEYAASHRFTVNEALGVVEVRDEAALERIQPALEQAAQATDARLLAHVSDADLARLGVDENTRTIARLLTSDAHLDAMQRMIPEAQYNALYLLAGGLPVEEVWAEVAQYGASGGPQDEEVDTGNLVKAMERTPGRVVFVQGNEELGKILEHPFAAWRIFLHPAQRKIAYASRYAGPAQVSGGAGTGKTVTALHRAAHLGRRAAEQLWVEQSAASVLLTTFTRNLAEALQTQFDLLADDQDTRRQVEIRHVDSLAHRVVEQARGAKPVIMMGKELDDLWAAAVKEAGLPYVPSFLNREWEQVILAQDLRTEQEYLTASRAGQGTPLGKAQRRQVWALTHWVEAQLRALGRVTFTQLANEAARALRDGTVKLPYRHVIIDEAQDLHPAQWRLLRAAVPARPDDMFIVGDAHQRIYDNHVSLTRVGISVRGRSKRLTVNYRTTQEILALAVPALGKASVFGLDDETDTLAGYRSPLHGRRPKVVAARTREAEYDALVRHVTAWRDSGIEGHAIGIAARSNWMVKEAAAVLNAVGLRTVSLSAKAGKDAVRVGTMHGMKGLEFQAVAVIGVADGIVPAPSALTDAAEDPVAYAQDLQRERCLLFVALTRARDHLYISYSGSPSAFLGSRLFRTIPWGNMTTQNPWRTLSSRTVYSNSWLALREDTVIRPDGAEGIYSVVEIRPSCGIVAISENDQIALVGQWRYVHNKYSLEIPTGGSELGETPLEAAKRELVEETGLTAKDWTALGTIDNSNGATTDVAHIFLARNLTTGPAIPQGDEQVDLRWLPFADAVLSVMKGEITESVSVAGILKTELLGRSV